MAPLCTAQRVFSHLHIISGVHDMQEAFLENACCKRFG